MMNKGLDILTIKDYSLQLEVLGKEKLIKLLHVVSDNILDLEQQLLETKNYKVQIEEILNNMQINRKDLSG